MSSSGFRVELFLILVVFSLTVCVVVLFSSLFRLLDGKVVCSLLFDLNVDCVRLVVCCIRVCCLNWLVCIYLSLIGDCYFKVLCSFI